MAHTLRRSFLRLSMAAGITFGLAAAGCSDEPDAVVVRPATATAPDAADVTPTVSGAELPAFAPDEVERRLTQDGDAFPGLPEGYSVDSLEKATSSPLMPQVQRVLTYNLAGPDLQDRIIFYIHENAEQARDGWGGTGTIRGFPTFPLEGLPYPARIVTYLGPDGDVGYTVFLIHMGQTVIECVSALAVDTPEGSYAHASEMALTAIARLESVLKASP